MDRNVKKTLEINLILAMTEEEGLFFKDFLPSNF
jgi:hypothetical protein